MASLDKILDSEVLHEHQGEEIEGGKVGGVIPVDTVNFNTAYIANGEPVGSFYWNPDRETMNLHVTNDVTLQLGEEMWFNAINQTGVDIPNGTVVMFDGSLGASGIIKCKPAIADGTYPSQYIMGVTTEPIANGDMGKVTFFGEVRDIDTKTYDVNKVLYVDPNVPGGLTQTVPQAPDLKYSIAVPLNAKSNGAIFVRAIFPLKLSELDDVELSGVADGDLLQYVAASGRWENKSITTALTPALDARYLKLDTSNNPLTGNLEFDSTSARSVSVQRGVVADTAGKNLTIQAGGATSGSSNKTGGNVNIIGGIGTGNSSGFGVSLQTYTVGSSGTADQTGPTSRLFVATSVNSRIIIGNASSTLSDTLDGLNFLGTVAQNIYHKRHTTADTAGNNLTITAGSATSGATDKNAGSLVLRTGISTGTGNSSIIFQTATPAATTGTSDNTQTTRYTIYGNGSQTSTATVTNTASGATGVFNYTPTISPTANSSTEFRALYYQNLVPLTTYTLNILTAGHFENRVRTDTTISTSQGLNVSGLVVDSSSAATASVTTVKGAYLAGVSRPTGTTTLSSTTVIGVETVAVGSGSVTATDVKGINILNPAAGTYTNLFGLYINSQTRGATNIGLLIAEPSGGATANYALQLSGTSGNASSGITFGTDTTLYRSAANTLKTDDNFVANNIAAGATVSGANTGDETTSTIKTKLGSSSSTTDGYLTSADWNTFNGKGTGDVVGPFFATDGNLAVFDGATGKLIKDGGIVGGIPSVTSNPVSGVTGQQIINTSRDEYLIWYPNYWYIIYTFISSLKLESDDFLLLEDGYKILLEIN